MKKDRIMHFPMDISMLVLITVASKTSTTANQSVLTARLWLREFTFFPFDKYGLGVRVENEEQAHIESLL